MGIFIKNESWQSFRGYLFPALFAFIFASSIFYVYFLNLAAYKMAEREKNIFELENLKTAHQESEIAYMEITRKLDLSLAQSLGFVEASPDRFVYRQRTVAQQNYGEVFR